MSGLFIFYHKWVLTLLVDLPFLSGFCEKTSEEKRIFSKMIVKIFMSTETFIFTSMCLGILKWKKYAMSNTALVYHNYFYCGIMITFTVIRLVLSFYFFLLSFLVFVSVSVSAFLFLSLKFLTILKITFVVSFNLYSNNVIMIITKTKEALKTTFKYLFCDENRKFLVIFV